MYRQVKPITRTKTCSRRLFICLYQPVAYIVRKPPQSLQYRIPIQSNTPQAKAGLCLKHNLVRPLPATRGICKSNLATPPPLMSRIPAKPSRCPRWPPCTATEPCATNTTWFRAWKPGGGSGWCSTGRRTGDCPVPSPETIDILSGCRTPWHTICFPKSFAAIGLRLAPVRPGRIKPALRCRWAMPTKTFGYTIPVLPRRTYRPSKPGSPPSTPPARR